MLRALLVDNHPVVRWGFRQIVEALADDVCVAADVATAQEAIRWLSVNDADIAVVDIMLDGRSGLDLAERMRSEFPALKVMMYTRHTAREFALRAFRVGAVGFLEKDASPDEVVHALRQTGRNGSYINAKSAEILRMAAERRTADQPHEKLSPREDEVFRAMLRGESVTAIAHRLSLSVKTISTHRVNVLAKLEIKSTAELVRYALERNIEF